MDHERDLLMAVFRSEADECLGAMEQALVALETTAEDPELIATLFRAAHTLKGSGASMGFSGVAKLAHSFEELLDAVRQRRLSPSESVVSLLLEGVDALTGALASGFDGNNELTPAQEQLASRVLAACPQRLRPSSSASGLPKAGLASEFLAQAPSDEAPMRGVATATRRHREHDTIRVGLDRLDHLLAVVGQLAIANGRLERLLGSQDADLHRAWDAHQESQRWQQELRELSIQIRMISLGPVFRQHARTVRDLCTAAGKKARLVIDGEDVEIDASVIEHVREALVHLIRNAVDHGLESPPEREIAGKDAIGTVSLTASRHGGDVVISVADDGRGLDLSRIRSKAVERGMIDPDVPLDSAATLELLFASGFSTADTVTSTSGRGVGLDVVRHNLERIRGSVHVHGGSGQGTIFNLRFPLTLALLEGLRLDVAGETYVIPLADVAECLDVAPREDSGEPVLRDQGILDLRGHALPYLRLRALINCIGPPCSRESVIVLRRTGSPDFGLAVDSILGIGPALIEPLSTGAAAPAFVSGCTVLENGRVALVMNPRQITAISR